MIEPFAPHHRTFASSAVTDGFNFDFDSVSFATMKPWLAACPDWTRLGFRLVSTEGIDAKYDDLAGAGPVGQQPPYDTLIGARYAIVLDPDGDSVGLMGPTRRASSCQNCQRTSRPPPELPIRARSNDANVR